MLPAGTESLLQGEGGMEWRLWGAWRVASARGAAVGRAARVRWLSEATAFPQALLPSAFLRWEAVEGRADQGRAVVDYMGERVAATFTFDARHNVVECALPLLPLPARRRRGLCICWVVEIQEHGLAALQPPQLTGPPGGARPAAPCAGSAAMTTAARGGAAGRCPAGSWAAAATTWCWGEVLLLLLYNDDECRACD